MKRYKLNWLLCMVAFLAISCVSAEKTMAQPRAMVSFQTFYDELAPYGRWINDPEYGYVWAPDVEPDFHPYATRGYWVMTEYGNTWVSDYVWGWAPFHYGRWIFDDYYGWLWIPGNEWGPAWVAWRSGAGYYGWAPLGPGINIHISVNIPVARWIFVPRRYITHPYLYSYCIPRTRVVQVYHHTTIINNYYTTNNYTYVYGPRAQEIERHTRSRVRVHQVNHDSRPGRTVVQNGSVRVYRPDVSTQRGAAPAQAISRSNNSRANNQVGSSFVEKNNRNEPVERNEGRSRYENNERNSTIDRNNNVDRNNNIDRRNSSERRSNTQDRVSPAYGRGNSDYRSNPENRSTDRSAAPHQQRMEQETRPQLETSPRTRDYRESTERSEFPQTKHRPSNMERRSTFENRNPQRSGPESVQPRTYSNRENYQPHRQEQPQPRQQPQVQQQRQMQQQQPQMQSSPRQESSRGGNGNVRSRRD